MLHQVLHNDQIIAIIIHSTYSEPGIKFLTPDSFSQQLAYMKHPQKHVIPPHVHNPVVRTVEFTKEVLFIKSGRIRVDFYDDGRNYLESRILQTGDVILLSSGGHGFEILEESEIIEVKQGPYAGEKDKTRFQPVDDASVKIVE